MMTSIPQTRPDEGNDELDSTNEVNTEGLSAYLKSQTTTAHERLDQSIMRTNCFRDLTGYRQFLLLQYGFHWAVQGLYRDPQLQAWLREAGWHSRFDALTKDCMDLGVSDESLILRQQSIPQVAVDPATALGWVYAVEGSTIGAGFLLKLAKKLGLSETLGASHMAGHEQGRAKHWQQFKQVLDALPLSPQQRERACQGGRDAFTFVRAQVDVCFT